jgi:hypothetical protein
VALKEGLKLLPAGHAADEATARPSLLREPILIDEWVAEAELKPRLNAMNDVALAASPPAASAGGRLCDGASRGKEPRSPSPGQNSGQRTFGAHDWPHVVSTRVAALVELLASEPCSRSYARRCVDRHAADRAPLRCGIVRTRSYIAPGFDEAPEPTTPSALIIEGLPAASSSSA